MVVAMVAAQWYHPSSAMVPTRIPGEPEANLTLDMRVANSILDKYLADNELAPTSLVSDG